MTDFYNCFIYENFLYEINKRHTTELANCIWGLKDNNTGFKIKREILSRLNQNSILNLFADFVT